MDLEELIRKLQGQVDFWRKDSPASSPALNRAKDTIRTTGKIVDDQLLGGTFQANMRGPDALLRQLALNAALAGAGAGTGVGLSKASTKVAPRISALMEWIRPRDIGVHLSPFDDLKKIQYGFNSNQGARATEKFPLVPNQTYKLSSTDVNNVKMPAEFVAESASDYSFNIPPNDEGFINAYVTRSRVGDIDPEVARSVGRKMLYGNQDVATFGANSRIVPQQKVVNNLRIQKGDIYDEFSFRNKELKKLEQIIESEKKKELARSILRGSAVGGAVATPVGVAIKGNKK
jgi:hypothetical protein